MNHPPDDAPAFEPIRPQREPDELTKPSRCRKPKRGWLRGRKRGRNR